MTLALDTTGLLARYLEGPTHAVAVQAMNSDPDWCASALVLSEAMMLMDRLGLDALLANSFGPVNYSPRKKS